MLTISLSMVSFSLWLLYGWLLHPCLLPVFIVSNGWYGYSLRCYSAYGYCMHAYSLYGGCANGHVLNCCCILFWVLGMMLHNAYLLLLRVVTIWCVLSGLVRSGAETLWGVSTAFRSHNGTTVSSRIVDSPARQVNNPGTVFGVSKAFRRYDSTEIARDPRKGKAPEGSPGIASAHDLASAPASIRALRSDWGNLFMKKSQALVKSAPHDSTSSHATAQPLIESKGFSCPKC